MTNNKPADSQMASSQVISSELTGLAGDKQMRPGENSQATDSHVKCIELADRQASS